MTHSEWVIRRSGIDSGAAVQKQEAADERLGHSSYFSLDG